MTPLTRVERIETLKECEKRIRVVRQGLEEEERRERIQAQLHKRLKEAGA